MPIRLTGKIKPFVDGIFRLFDMEDAAGLYVKSVSATGLVTYQDANDEEQTEQLSLGSGAAITVGTADPSGGSVGDAYIQRDASDVIQAIWLNLSGGWAEYTIPTGDGGAGLTALQKHLISLIQGVVDSTEDLAVLNTTRTWADAAAADAQFSVSVARPTNAELESGTYGTAHTYTNLNAASGYVVIRLALASDILNFRLHKTESDSTERTYSGSHFRHLHSDATYRYHGYEIAPQAGDVIRVEEDEVTHSTAYRGNVDSAQIAAPDGSGNLAASVSTVAQLVAAIDALSLGGGGGGGTVTTAAPVSGIGSVANPVTIANHAISHLKLGSTVGGVNQPARHITEADGAGGVRWTENNALTADEADAAARLLNQVLGDPADEVLYTAKTYYGDVFIVVPRTYDTTATFTEYARYSDVSALWNEQASTYRWRGVHASSSRLQNEQTGDVSITHSGKFYHINSSGNFAHLGHPDGWRGQWNDEADALHHVTDDNEVVQYGESLWLTSDYVAGTTVQEWADYDPGVHVYMPSDQLLHEQTLVEKIQGVLRDVKKVDSRFGVTPTNAGFAVFENDPTTSELEAGTYGTTLHTYDDMDDTYQHIVWEIPIDEDVLDFWQEIAINGATRLIDGALMPLVHTTTTNRYYRFDRVHIVNGATTIIREASGLSRDYRIESRMKLIEQHLGSNLHGDISDPDNPLDLNHIQVISDDIVEFSWDSERSAGNQHFQVLTEVRMLGHIYTVGDEELYLTQVKHQFDPDPALRYNIGVCTLDANGLPLSIALSTSQYNGINTERRYSFDFAPPLTLEVDGDYFIGLVQTGGYSVSSISSTWANRDADDPVVSGTGNDDDITLVQAARLADASNGWRPNDVIGATFTLEGDTDRLEGRPVLQFHKTLSSDFTDPPSINVQVDGAAVHTIDHNNRVKILNFRSNFAVPNSSDETVNISLTAGFEGAYNNATAYSVGQSVTANGHLWMAPTTIVAGVGQPSLVSPHGWALISRADRFLGDLVGTNSYDLLANNWYRIGHRVFFVIADVAGVTGAALHGGHADIVELTSHHLTEAQATDEASTVFGQVSGERLSQAVAEFESAGGGGSGSGYGDWASIGSVTGAISGNPVTVALNANETIDDYEELYIHIEANDTNDQRVVSGRFRVSDVPTTTLAGGGLGIPFAGNNTDEGAVLVRRNADGDSLVLDAFGSVINFPATAVTSIYARELTAGGGGAGTDDQTAAEVPVTATGFTGNLSSTDTDVQAALDTIDALSLGGGGGGGGATPDRIVLADAVGVSNTAGPHEIALTEAMVARQWLTFFVFTTAGASPDGIGYALSDDLLALTAEATAPTDAENAWPVVMASYSASNFTQQSGNYFVFRKDDSTLWVRPTRLAAHTLTITATPMGGGALTTSEQESLSNARVLTSRDFNGLGNGIATLGSGAEWPQNSPNIFVVTATEYADIERLELLLTQNGKADIPIVINRGNLDGVAAGAFMPNSPTDSQRIRGIFHYGRIGAANRNMNMPVLNPRFDLMEERREASDNCILIQYGLNGTLFTSVYIRARQPAGGLIFTSAKLFYWVDA